MVAARKGGQRDWTYPEARELWRVSDGPWDDEPCRRQWKDEATGLQCLASRNSGGAWCGYIGVALGHPWFGVGYNDVVPAAGRYVEVHWGLTYSGGIGGDGLPDGLWWLGFDCCHSGDMSPSDQKYRIHTGGTYRDLRFVMAEVRSLAAQAAEVSS